MADVEELDELPVSQGGADQSALMKKYFGAAPKKKIEWKYIIIIVVAFVVLSLPITNALCGKVPYCSGTYGALGLKTIALALLLLGLFMFM